MTIISIFHNEGKSQNVLERLASQVLYESKVMENRLESKTLSETGKGAQATWITSSLRGLSRKVNTSFTRNGLRLVSVHRGPPCFRKEATTIISPLLNERRQTCHTWAKEKKNWTRAQWSKVAIYQAILDHFMLSSAEKLYEDAKSFSSRKVKNTTKGFAKHAITVLQCSSQLSWHQPNRTFKEDEKLLKLISSSQAGLQ